MKVMHLTTVDLSLRYLVFAQLRSIEELGGESVGVSAPGRWVPDLVEAGIRHVPLPASTRGVAPMADLRSALQLWRVLRRERPDVLHTHNPKPGLYGRVLGRLAGVPIVINTVHGLYAAPDDPLTKRLIVYLLEGIAARFSDLELVQSSEDLALMERYGMVRRGRGQLLGNGIDLSRFDPSRRDLRPRGSVREELNVSEDEIVVGIVGRLVAEKGFVELFEAAAQLGPGYTLVVVGPDDREKADALDAGIIEAARNAGIKFLGMRTDLDDLYPAMDIFVLPSHREGFPRAAMEAAAMGLPIVATDIRGCREVVDHGRNGLLVPVNDPEALAEAIRTLGSNPSTRALYGRAGRKKALAEFDERRVVFRVLEAYRQVAAEKGLTPLNQALGAGSATVELRPATIDDAPAMARLHVEGITSGFLSSLGLRFMRRLYEALVGWERAVVLVADAGAGAVGFVAGVDDTAAFYRYFARHHGVAAATAAFPALTRPSNLRRALETARYGSGDDAGVAAELLAMAVDSQWRGRGIGAQLGGELLSELGGRGVDAVKVVVGEANEPAIRAYRRMGFEPAGTQEVHSGEPSSVLVWSA